MSGVWCDVLLVRFSNGMDNQIISFFYPVPFSSMGLTVKRVLDIEEKLNAMPYMARPHVLGCELLNEMMIDENLVETIITREQMKTILDQGEPHVE